MLADYRRGREAAQRTGAAPPPVALPASSPAGSAPLRQRASSPLPARREATATAVGVAQAGLQAEVIGLRTALATHAAEYDRLGFNVLPGGASAVAGALSAVTNEAAELRAALASVREELRDTRDELAAAGRRLALEEERRARAAGKGEGREAVEKGEALARKSAVLARLSTLRAVAETVQNLLERARRRLRPSSPPSPGVGDGSGSPSAWTVSGSSLLQSSDAVRRAEAAVADAWSTCRTLGLEQEALAREIVDLGSLQPRDEVIQSMSRQLTHAREREVDANAIAEAAEAVRDAAMRDTAATASSTSAALYAMSAKLEDQITCADNLEAQLGAERSRSSALESRLTSANAAIARLEAERAQLTGKVAELSGAVSLEAAKFVAYASAHAAEEGRLRDAVAAAAAAVAAGDAAQGALARSEYARARAEAAAADADAVAVRADRSYTSERAAKVTLTQELKRVQEELREVRNAQQAAEDRHRGVEADMAELARKPTPTGGLNALAFRPPAKPSPPPGSPPPFR